MPIRLAEESAPIIRTRETRNFVLSLRLAINGTMGREFLPGSKLQQFPDALRIGRRPVPANSATVPNFQPNGTRGVSGPHFDPVRDSPWSIKTASKSQLFHIRGPPSNHNISSILRTRPANHNL